MSQQFSAFTYPDYIFKPTTSDEVQELKDNPRFHTWYKGHLTRSEIYERLLPDGESAALRIDGPSDSAIVLDSKGCLRLITGERNKEQGPGSGKLCIRTSGQQQLHEDRSNIQYNAGDDEEGQALNILAYGDIVERTIGGTRYIKAQKIVVEASEELMLIGKSQVSIQAGANGGGSITMIAGNIEKITNNDKEIITGQRVTYGVSEDTTINFDPRASVNVVSPGHVNWKILGDYQQWVGGIEQHIVAGGVSVPPLVKDRSSAYTVKTAVGGQNYDAAGFINQKAGGLISIDAVGAVDILGGGAMAIKAGGAIEQTSGGVIDMKAAAAINIKAGANVSIKGALIYLN